MATVATAGAAAASTAKRRGGRRLRTGLAIVAGAVAIGGAAAYAYTRLQRRRRQRQALEQLDRWCEHGPAEEPVVECEVPIEHGMDGAGGEPETDVVEVPVGLVFECERLRATLRALLLAGASPSSSSTSTSAPPPSSADEAAADGEVDAELVEALRAAFEASEAAAKAAGDEAADGEGAEPVAMKCPWVDLAALAQLTYWYDRRPRSMNEDDAPTAGDKEAPSAEEERAISDSKYGRWTKKLNREKVIYGTVALRHRTRGHLGQQVFRRPAGVDVTRLGTLRRAAALCGHGPLGDLVEDTMEKLRPKNVARIPWEEVKRHTTAEDCWLLIDGKVYDATPFLGLHPGGGQLVIDATGKDATSLFEMTHGEGLRYSLRLLNQFFIGVCEGSHKAKAAEEAKPTSEFLETLRSITGALHTFDEAKATGEAQGMLR